MLSFLSCLSLSRNTIYGIHVSYYSLSCSLLTGILFMCLWLVLSFYSFFFLSIFIILFINAIGGLITFLLFWLNDLWIELIWGLTRMEQYLLIVGIRLLLITELMVFFTCFWCLINLRFLLNAFSLLFLFPVLSNYSFSIPFSNILILLLSSLPIQGAFIGIKIGFFNIVIEGLGQTVFLALLFMLLQLKEFLWSYYTLTNSLIGSILFFTTGLHGFHVLLGSFGYVIILLYVINIKLVFFEYNLLL